MRTELLVLAYVATVLVIVGAFFYLKRKKGGVQPQEEDAGQQEAPRGGRAVPRPRDRLQRARQANAPVPPEQKLGGEDDEDEEEEDGDEDELDANGNLTKAALKRRRKLEQKRRVEDQKAGQTAKAAKDAAREAKRKEREDAREAAEKAAADAAAARKEEKDKKEKEEFDQWKTMFSTETAGTEVAEDGKDEQGLLSEFIAFIKERKVVVLEDLATHFKLRSTDAIARVKTLEESGAITGVFDDRGKFIYLTQEELDGVANWMKEKGRMTIQEIVAECNKLINLTPPEQGAESG